jgi:SAM-dependent methyltransferase
LGASTLPASATEGSLATACPLCAGNNLKLYLKGSPHALDLSAFGSSRTELSCGTILRCANCSLAFTETRPSAEQLQGLYRNMDTAVYESETAGRVRTAQRHLKILHRYAAGPGRLLDVGCASGRFLDACARAGWSAVGIEPSEMLSAQARQLLAGRATVLAATLQDAALDRASFDAVTMWDVLEHVTDPAQFFQTALSLVKPGGLIAANVPNLDSLPARVLGRRWPLLLPEHLNYFNPASLRTFGRHGDVTLEELGVRPVNFTLGYVFHRVSQHAPQLSGLSARVSRSGLRNRVVPVWMGELYAIWRKAN